MSISIHRHIVAAVRSLGRLALAAALPAALAALAAPDAQAQGTGRITGVVTGENGQPIPAVQVVVVNTNVGAVTGSDGR